MDAERVVELARAYVRASLMADALDAQGVPNLTLKKAQEAADAAFTALARALGEAEGRP